MKDFASIDEYISNFPKEIQEKLNKIRKTVQELAPYRTGKGTIQFSYNKPLSIELIKKVIEFRIEKI